MHFDHSRAPLELVPAGKKELGDEKSFQPSNAKEKYDSLALSVTLYGKTTLFNVKCHPWAHLSVFLGVRSSCLPQCSVH